MDIQSIYNRVYEKPLKVYNIFKDFFGEDKVDLQRFKTLEEATAFVSETTTEEDLIRFLEYVATGDILVYFPLVKVTNEYDRFVYIQDLYAKVTITREGNLATFFTLNRATYPEDQFKSNYMHSHISVIPMDNFSIFQSPCVGTGPIRNTMSSLIREYDESLWNLFCLELDKYVTVESIAGTPYHRLESIGSGIINYNEYYKLHRNNKKSTIVSRFYQNFPVHEFIEYLIKKSFFRFNYVNGLYTIAYPELEYIVRLSSHFVDWFNVYNTTPINTVATRDLLRSGYLHEYIIRDDKFYKPENAGVIDIDLYQNKFVCRFKGNEIRTRIITRSIEESPVQNTYYILDFNIVEYISTLITNIMNYYYGKPKSGTYQKVKFI